MRSVLLLALIAYHFDRPVPQDLLDAMKEETASILRQSGIEFNWWDKGSATAIPDASDVFVLRFHGPCGPAPVMRTRRAPLAVTHVADGEVLPFSDVDCSQVLASLATVGPASDLVFGRALGRVAAHELVHIITRSRAHGRHGVAQPAFTPWDLTADQFTLAPEDVDRVRDCFR